MYYKVWTGYFIEHVRIPHSILSHFLDRGFLGWRAQNWASVVSCPTNSTESSAIYKLTSGLADYLEIPYLAFFWIASYRAGMLKIRLCCFVPYK